MSYKSRRGLWIGAHVVLSNKTLFKLILLFFYIVNASFEFVCVAMGILNLEKAK
jgi:hypothetical protein